MTDAMVTIPMLIQAKKDGRKLVMVTAYDYPFGLIADEAGVDLVLVGDSLGMVVLGLDSTVPVTIEMMIHHIQAVVGCNRVIRWQVENYSFGRRIGILCCIVSPCH